MPGLGQASLRAQPYPGRIGMRVPVPPTEVTVEALDRLSPDGQVTHPRGLPEHFEHPGVQVHVHQAKANDLG